VHDDTVLLFEDTAYAVAPSLFGTVRRRSQRFGTGTWVDLWVDQDAPSEAAESACKYWYIGGPRLRHPSAIR
jgi:hypothetical protein